MADFTKEIISSLEVLRLLIPVGLAEPVNHVPPKNSLAEILPVSSHYRKKYISLCG